MPEITVENISKRFGDELALSDVTFTVCDGEFLTLLGPSGCGKTTTLMSIAGFQEPDSGRIAVSQTTFFDSEARVLLPAEDRNLGMVFQSYAVWPHMTVSQNVGFPLKIRKLSKSDVAQRVTETLELVEMTAYADRYPHELSGGQQQRVALARALVYRPSVLLLDEPFSNLDAKLRERARVWLKQLQASLGLTTVFVTHDQDEALSMSDRILVIDHGVVLQDGTPEEVYRQPATRFVAEFLGHCNILGGVVVARPGDAAIIALGPEGRPRAPDATGSAAPLDASSPRVTVEGGELRTGDRVELALRPEAISLAPADAGLGSAFTARITARAFLGDHYIYELEAGGVSLSASAPQSLDGPAVAVGISPGACRVLARERSPGPPPTGPAPATHLHAGIASAVIS
jgi:iron(III) transport system ATP-binding protein